MVSIKDWLSFTVMIYCTQYSQVDKHVAIATAVCQYCLSSQQPGTTIIPHNQCINNIHIYVPH